MLGHELRNPLGAVSNAVALLDARADARRDGAASARAIIARQTAHLARLTDDLLDVARAITGKIVLTRAAARPRRGGRARARHARRRRGRRARARSAAGLGERRPDARSSRSS